MQKAASLRDVQPGRHKGWRTADHSQGQGQDPGLKGPSTGAPPKPQRLLKLISQEKQRQGLWSMHIPLSLKRWEQKIMSSRSSSTA